MQKIILSPTECQYLVPNWHELNESKFNKLKWFVTRGSRTGFEKGNTVLSVPPILITPDDFILNGKHRAFVSATAGFNLEACIIKNENDLRHHTPKESIKDTALNKMVDLLDNRFSYISLVNFHGINTIADLVKKNEEKKDHFSERGEYLRFSPREKRSYLLYSFYFGEGWL